LRLAVVTVTENDPLGNARGAHAVRLGVAGMLRPPWDFVQGMMHGVFIWRRLDVESGSSRARVGRRVRDKPRQAPDRSRSVARRTPLYRRIWGTS
jgi:hypothetical protein